MEGEPLTPSQTRRILARAVELDARSGTETSLEQLRAAALEAGISAAAFDQAVTSCSAGARGRGVVAAVRRNALAVAGFWISLLVLVRLARLGGAGWELRHLVDILALGIGFAAAYRLRARLAGLFLGGLAASQLAKWIAHLVWGIEAVQGGPTQWSLMGAGAQRLVRGSTAAAAAQ